MTPLPSDPPRRFTRTERNVKMELPAYESDLPTNLGPLPKRSGSTANQLCQNVYQETNNQARSFGPCYLPLENGNA